MLIYCDGECREEIENKIKDNDILDTFLLKGFTNDVNSKLQESAIFVMSSRFEGYPMALIEAMVCGLPCISFDIYCGPSDIIDDGVNGFLVNFNDVNTMADRIIKLIEDKELRQNMSVAAQEKSKQFGMDNVMLKWKKLFENGCL